MRSEQDMMELILGVARTDERIRAVYMNGSRTNPNAPRDIFQDYDIVYVVTETASFLQDEQWISVFGNLIMIQEPDKLDQAVGKQMDFSRSYTYLMLFTDGNRIDLHIETKESMLSGYVSDSLTVPLLDKDSCLPSIAPASDIDYHVNRPSEAHYVSCCNDFWWCLQNVAKGIWRDELPYARLMFEQTTRASLDKVIAWWIGTRHGFQVSPGKMGKYFKRYLPASYWSMYEQTYADHSYEQLWSSIFLTCELFRILAQDVAEALSFTYKAEDDANMTAYLKQVRGLPRDAEGIY